MPNSLALRRLGQENHKFQAILGLRIKTLSQNNSHSNRETWCLFEHLLLSPGGPRRPLD
jgi:hypothetical protein